MNFTDLPAEEQRVCSLVREETRRRLAAERPFSLYLVGSRATGEAWPTSDFDFVIDADEPLPGKVINPLREALEQLRVPYAWALFETAMGRALSRSSWTPHLATIGRYCSTVSRCWVLAEKVDQLVVSHSWADWSSVLRQAR